MNPLQAIARRRRLHLVPAGLEPKTARKRWIAGSLKPPGALTLDAGALKALLSGRSLLPAGVTRVDGQFERGDAVRVAGADGREVARGLSAYSAGDARRIWATRAAKSPTSSAIAAVTRSSIATIWYCCRSGA